MPNFGLNLLPPLNLDVWDAAIWYIAVAAVNYWMIRWALWIAKAQLGFPMRVHETGEYRVRSGGERIGLFIVWPVWFFVAWLVFSMLQTDFPDYSLKGL